MGFKIGSLANMSTIASNVANTATDAQNKIASTQQTLTDLVTVVTGSGVDTTLQKLGDGISKNGNDAIKLLNDISTFITSQVSSYSTNEEDISSALTGVDNMLQDLEG